MTACGTTSVPERRPSVAVVGSGVAGLTAAYLLSRSHAVTLYEADERLGGHAHTHDVTDRSGRTHAVDSGFIVHNAMTYPWLRKLFAELQVDVRATEMSMSVRCDDCGLQYAGGRGIRGILAQPRRLLDRDFLGMLLQVRRFHRRAAAFLRSGEDLVTYGQFLERERFGAYFIAHYAVPVVSCVWSSGREAALQYPARYLFQFLAHHGMLSVSGSPQWYTVVGGSRTYVERLAALLPDVRRSHPVTDISRTADGVRLRDASGQVATFDRVVIATHADQALDLLSDPTDAEVTALKAFGYSRNGTVLHTDATVLPDAPNARASWNYRMQCRRGHDRAPVVSYWMNRLQRIDADEQYLVTLNDTDRLDPERVVAAMEYDHPVHTLESVEAQVRLPELATDQTVYAGAYHGWGFHEDGCRSGVEAARHFGVHW